MGRVGRFFDRASGAIHKAGRAGWQIARDRARALDRAAGAALGPGLRSFHERTGYTGAQAMGALLGGAGVYSVVSHGSDVLVRNNRTGEEFVVPPPPAKRRRVTIPEAAVGVAADLANYVGIAPLTRSGRAWGKRRTAFGGASRRQVSGKQSVSARRSDRNARRARTLGRRGAGGDSYLKRLGRTYL